MQVKDATAPARMCVRVNCFVKLMGMTHDRQKSADIAADIIGRRKSVVCHCKIDRLFVGRFLSADNIGRLLSIVCHRLKKHRQSIIASAATVTERGGKSCKTSYSFNFSYNRPSIRKNG